MKKSLRGVVQRGSIIDAPFAVATDGRVLVNAMHFGHVTSPQQALKRAA